MPPAYWDPLPTARALAAADARFPVFQGRWADRNWRNVPGPFYGADTDCMMMGRLEAPHHIAYDGEREFVFRQPVTAEETGAFVHGAGLELYTAYACDGDDHWTVESVRDWWADRGRVREWAVAIGAGWAAYDPESPYSGHYREAAQGHRDFVAYIDDGGLEAYLRGYLFWLEHLFEPGPGQALPAL
ncbi:ferredoxin [Streptomyces sp. NBC_00029]|uniref:ferredoxin n=1 Tax=Streptomyces sp. NBC_00029 TaxID=2903613 RepID=UPI003253B6F4